MSQQGLGWHLCSSLPCFEELANSFCWLSYSFHYHSNPTTGSTRGNQQCWQSNPETGSCSFRESNIPPHWRSCWRCRHASRSGAAEPQRRGDGRDGAAVLRVQQQAMLLLWFWHLWGTHQGSCWSPLLALSSAQAHLHIPRKLGCSKEKSLMSAAEQTASPHSAADPPHCRCLSLGLEGHLTLLQTFLSQPGWCSTHPRYSLHILIPVSPDSGGVQPRQLDLGPAHWNAWKTLNANGFSSKIKSSVAFAAVVGSKRSCGPLSHPDPLLFTLQSYTPFYTANLSSRYCTTFPIPVFPFFLPSTVFYISWLMFCCSPDWSSF